LILEKLTIENFRQYLGRQEIVFATGKTKNVTLIHGENGFGKTCFLNALLWGFYGRDGLTSDLPMPENIIPDSVREKCGDRNSAVASIKINFKHGDQSYILLRSISLADERDSKGEKTKLELAIRRTDGQTFNNDGREAQKMIDQMLPRDLRELVFFNGERIDHFAMEQNAEDVRDAVTGLLGLKLISKTIEDLKSQDVCGKLRTELRDNTDQETADLLATQARLENELQSRRNDLTTCRKNQASCTEELASIRNRLDANREAHQLQQRRSVIDAELTDHQKAVQEIEKRISELIANDAYALFCAELVTKGKTITHRLRAEGRIPARVMNDFIHDLLKAQVCICGNHMPEGSEAWKKVEEQLTKAGDPEFNRAVGDLDKAVGVIEGTITQARNILERLVEERSTAVNRIAQIHEELTEIREQLNLKDDQEVHELEDAREKAEHRRDELHVEDGSLATKIGSLETELETVAKQISAKKQKATEAQRAQRRLERLNQVISLLEQILQLESKDLVTELGREVERVFRAISLHDYRLQLTDQFTLRLTKLIPSDGGQVQVDVATGTGQRQVMSLVFIASLVALAKRRNEIPTILRDLQGGDFPLVMDSPFGQLGEEFRSAVARHIPELAPQLIILVSSTQYAGDVERELGQSDRVGRRYILRYHAPTKRADANNTATISGREITIFQKDEIEHTQLMVVDS
jgi:DNA sulfur modification protein DndD